jgi:hypothetical protein
MSDVKKEVVKGINDFIKEQQDDVKGTSDVVVFSLTSFDTNVQEIFVKEDISLVKPVNVKQTFLGGGTALFDAIGRTLTKAEDDAALRNIVVIYTDGEENSSKEFTKDQIEELVEKLSDTGNWQFIYLGAEFADFQEDSAFIAVAAGGGGSFAGINTAKSNVAGTWANVTQTANYHRNANDAQYGTINTRGGLINASKQDVDLDWDSVEEPVKTPTP